MGPFKKCLMLQGVLTAASKVVTASESMLGHLAGAWAPIFARKNVPKNLVEQYVDTHISKLDFSGVPPPTIADYERFLRRAPSTAPGADGIPYAAWKSGGYRAASLLWSCGQWMMMGRPMGYGFNVAVHSFVPTGQEEGDGVAVLRAPKKTRPLGLTK